MIARKLNLNLSAIAIKNAPGNEAFPTHLVGRGKICDLDITRSIVRTKITTARAMQQEASESKMSGQLSKPPTE
jgi:hypothetical protein